MTPDSEQPRPMGLDPSTSPTLQVEPVTPEEAARLLSEAGQQAAPLFPPRLRERLEQATPPADDLLFAPPLVRHTTQAARLLQRKAGQARVWVEARTSRRTRLLGAAGLLALVLALLLWPDAPPSTSAAPAQAAQQAAPAVQEPGPEERVRQRLEAGDALSALALARGLTEGGTEAAASRLLLARAALQAREPEEALTVLETAAAGSAAITQQADFARAAVGTFAAGKLERTQALLARVPKEGALSALQAATTAWEEPVRKGALQTLEKLGEQPRDAVAVLALEAWQAARCAEQRTHVRKLLALEDKDARVRPLLDMLGRRKPGGCLKALLVSGRGD